MKQIPSWRNVVLAVLFSSPEMAVDDMRCLNVYAKQPEAIFSEKKTIYDMKNRMISWLYSNDFCASVCMQKQILKCNNDIHLFSDGSEKDPENFCEDCNGTGIYKTVNLYLYGFVMDRKVWSWHQPEEDALIKPEINARASFEEYRTQSRSLTDYGNVEQRMWNVWFFLLLNGMMKDDLEHRINRKIYEIHVRNVVVADYAWNSFKKKIGIKEKPPSNDLPF